MVNALAPWGVDPRAEELYRQMLRFPQATQEELMARHGWKEEELQASLRALIRARLVKLEGKSYHVVAPITAIDELVISEEDRLASRVKQLEEARAALRQYAAQYRPEPVKELPSAEIFSFGQWNDQMLPSFVAAADGPLRVVYSRHFSDSEARMAQLERVIHLGYPMRILMPSGLFGNEQILPLLQKYQTAQSQIRLGTDAKSAFTIYGSVAASILTDVEDFRCDRLVIRIPTLISILTSYFDSVWQNALPVDPEGVGEEVQVIALLGEGLKDETIARQLGISLRTVRRRIADFMDEVGAETRFQAGVEAHRRGLL